LDYPFDYYKKIPAMRAGFFVLMFKLILYQKKSMLKPPDSDLLKLYIARTEAFSRAERRAS
jgi:hypothetical protein